MCHDYPPPDGEGADWPCASCEEPAYCGYYATCQVFGCLAKPRGTDPQPDADSLGTLLNDDIRQTRLSFPPPEGDEAP